MRFGAVLLGMNKLYIFFYSYKRDLHDHHPPQGYGSLICNFERKKILTTNLH